MCVYSLEGNELGAAGAGALAEALKLNAVLTSIDVSYNEIGKDGAIAIAEALKSGRVVMNTVTLDGYGSGFPLPVKQLKGTEPVEALDFSSKGLGVASGIVIASLIEGNAVLTTIGCAFCA